MFHITAYGGSNGSTPFQQAIPQSPGFEISPDTALGYDTALAVASVLTGTAITTAEQLGALDSQTLIDVNTLVVNQSSYGTFTYGPAIDGGYVPDLPGVLLQQGKFDHSVNVMPGHNQHESTMFVPDISSDADFRESLEAFLFGVSNTTIDYIATVVYPNDLTGQYGYTTQTGRLQLVVNEEGFICNTRYLATAFDNETFSYIFTFPPAYHQQDVAFTFFAGDILEVSTQGTVVDPVLAVDMQQRFTRFVQSGNPNAAASIPQWPKYGEEAMLLDFDTLVSTVTDDAANARCDFWQSGDWRD
jgi:cholinesterase